MSSLAREDMCSVAIENWSYLARNSVAAEYNTSVMRIPDHTYVMLQQDAWRLLWNNTYSFCLCLPDCLHQDNILRQDNPKKNGKWRDRKLEPRNTKTYRNESRSKAVDRIRQEREKSEPYVKNKKGHRIQRHECIDA